MTLEQRLDLYRNALAGQISDALLVSFKAATRAVELAELNGLLDLVKACYAEQEHTVTLEFR